MLNVKYDQNLSLRGYSRLILCKSDPLVTIFVNIQYSHHQPFNSNLRPKDVRLSNEIP